MGVFTIKVITQYILIEFEYKYHMKPLFYNQYFIYKDLDIFIIRFFKNNFRIIIKDSNYNLTNFLILNKILFEFIYI